jgi:hypothetical protein
MVLDGTWLGSALVGAGDSVGICALGTGAAVSSLGRTDSLASSSAGANTLVLVIGCGDWTGGRAVQCTVACSLRTWPQLHELGRRWNHLRLPLVLLQVVPRWTPLEMLQE